MIGVSTFSNSALLKQPLIPEMVEVLCNLRQEFLLADRGLELVSSPRHIQIADVDGPLIELRLGPLIPSKVKMVF